MTNDQSCPACGERDDLRGQPGPDGIEVTCQQCGHRWSRGALRCRSCRGLETVSIPQVIARTSRGNQLSIMGHRDITLCPRCDAAVIATCRTARQWVPESYVSAFSFAPGSAATGHAPEHRSSVAAPPPTMARQAPPPPPASAPAQLPTVRQAVGDYMAADGTADARTMLALGTLLGSSTRMDALADRATADAVAGWYRDTWGDRDELRPAAHRTLRAAFGLWVSRGWLEEDPTVDLQA